MTSAIPTSLRDECRKCAAVIKKFTLPDSRTGTDQLIPKTVIDSCKGIAVLVVVKAGFFFSGRAGSGLVVAKLSDGNWSAPSAIGTGGLGWGLQIGAEMTEHVIVLNNDAAVRAFSRGGNVSLGGALSVAAGPVGRTGEGNAMANKATVAACYSYSRCKGIFAGVSLEGSVVVERESANKALYKKKIRARELLVGREPQPSEAKCLYEALDARSYYGGPSVSRGTKPQGYVPSQPMGGGPGGDPGMRGMQPQPYAATGDGSRGGLPPTPDQAGYGAPPQYGGPPPQNQSFHGAPPQNQSFHGAPPGSQDFRGAPPGAPQHQSFHGAPPGAPHNQSFHGAPPGAPRKQSFHEAPPGAPQNQSFHGAPPHDMAPDYDRGMEAPPGAYSEYPDSYGAPQYQQEPPQYQQEPPQYQNRGPPPQQQRGPPPQQRGPPQGGFSYGVPPGAPSAALTCPACGAEVQPGWKACPMCGDRL